MISRNSRIGAERGARKSTAEGSGRAVGRADTGRASLYLTPHSTHPAGTVEVLEFLTSDRYRAQVMAVRACRDRRERRRLKRGLPCITPAGVFDPRSADGLKTYSGLLCVDIDGADNPHVSDWPRAARALGKAMPSALYVGKSCGGLGIFSVHRIGTPERFAEHWAAIFGEVEALGLHPDRACKDICRLRFATYDPTAYVNADAEPHRLPPLQGEETREISTFAARSDGRTARKAADENTGPNGCGGFQAERVEAAVLALKHRGANITEHYADWYAVGCSLASELGEQGRAFFHAVSAMSAKYNPSRCDAQYTQCLTHCARYTLATFFWHCKQAGIRW